MSGLFETYDPYAAIGFPQQNTQPPRTYGNYGLEGTSLAKTPAGQSWMTPDHSFSPDNLNLGDKRTGGSEMFENFSLGAQGVLGLAQALQGYETNKLAKKQFNASLAGYNKNLANEGLLANQQLRDKASREAQMSGNRYGGSDWNQSVAAAPKLNVDPIRV